MVVSFGLSCKQALSFVDCFTAQKFRERESLPRPFLGLLHSLFLCCEHLGGTDTTSRVVPSVVFFFVFSFSLFVVLPHSLYDTHGLRCQR